MRDLVATCRGEWPNTSMCPLVGYSRPRSNFTVVDLPEPFGPSRPNTSPRRTSKLTSSTAFALGRPQKSLNTFVRPRTAITTSEDAGGDGGYCRLASAAGILVNRRDKRQNGDEAFAAGDSPSPQGRGRGEGERTLETPMRLRPLALPPSTGFGLDEIVSSESGSRSSWACKI